MSSGRRILDGTSHAGGVILCCGLTEVDGAPLRHLVGVGGSP